MSTSNVRSINSSRKSRSRPVLYYCTVGEGDGSAMTFAPPAVAEETDRIYRAITESKTWGEFRRRMPPQEYESLFAESFSADPEELAEDPDLALPADDAEFSCESVPGFCDGDYPQWIAGEQEKYVPVEILREFACRRDTFLNGSFWEIPIARRTEVLAALRTYGYELQEREDLTFW